MQALDRSMHVFRITSKSSIEPVDSLEHLDLKIKEKKGTLKISGRNGECCMSRFAKEILLARAAETTRQPLTRSKKRRNGCRSAAPHIQGNIFKS